MSLSEFDRFAKSYDKDLAKSLAPTGDSREFYAQERIAWTAQCISDLRVDVRHILDYGCGDGANASILAAKFRADRVVGVDVSSESIALARQSHQAPGMSFVTTDEWTPDGRINLVFVNGVFHHIPPLERRANLIAIRQALSSDGLIAFWENNPWNLGTQYVMSRCVFDADAITISPRQALKMLSTVGFTILQFDFLFYFPHWLRALRPVEHWLRRIPLGGQYQVICRPS
jgi:SAM-dependent methyltransferase